MNSVKVFLGNVYLTIPKVFSHTGWLGGILLYSLIALLNTYTMTTIIEVAAEYSKRSHKEIKQYTDLAKKVHGDKGRVLVIIFMFIV